MYYLSNQTMCVTAWTAALLTLAVASCAPDAKPSFDDVYWLMDHGTESWDTVALTFEGQFANASDGTNYRRYGQVWIDAPCEVRSMSGPDSSSPDMVYIQNGQDVVLLREDIASADQHLSIACPSLNASDSDLAGLPLFTEAAGLFDFKLTNGVDLITDIAPVQVSIAGRRALEFVGESQVVVDSRVEVRSIVFDVDAETGVILWWRTYREGVKDVPFEELKVTAISYGAALPSEMFDLMSVSRDLADYRFVDSVTP